MSPGGVDTEQSLYDVEYRSSNPEESKAMKNKFDNTQYK